MRPNDLDITLYDAGVHTLINSVVGPLVAYQDKDALSALVGYLMTYLGQPGSLNTSYNAGAIQAFILHAQRVQVIDVEFLDASFEAAVRAQVPNSPPVAPAMLTVVNAGGGVVNVSCPLGSGSVDQYDLYRQVGGVWIFVKQGTVREDGTGVDFQETKVTAETWNYRVVPRYGFFVGFPSDSVSVEVLND